MRKRVAICVATLSCLFTVMLAAVPIASAHPKPGDPIVNVTQQISGSATRGWTVRTTISVPPMAQSGTAAQSPGSVTPYAASSCQVIDYFWKLNSSQIESAGYVYCTGTTTISQSLGGDHCTFSLGGCLVWSHAWDAPYTRKTTAIDQYCPAQGWFYWSVPRGWLVRAANYVCALLTSGVYCEWINSPGVQF